MEAKRHKKLQFRRKNLTHGRRIANACSALMQGMYYPGSESDSFYESFCIPFPAQIVTAANFALAAQLSNIWIVTVTPLSDWLTQMLTTQEPADLATYKNLERLLGATRLAPESYRVIATPNNYCHSFHKTRQHFLRLMDGELSGLRVFSVET